ncbi:MAG: hydrogenase formation protein HypD [Planctomycetes bacterium]|nr:hydrogenase formation protein HypD [Planctomycetota bacterium]
MPSSKKTDLDSVIDAIRRTAGRIPADRVSLMEVCGTHTTSIFRHGIRSLLPEKILLISGPGCPVCVTPMGYLDTAIEIARRDDVIIATFGDMIRVPGSESTLEKERAAGANIRVVYSPTDALKLAQDNPDKKVVFLAVGFETTAPTTAIVVKQARDRGVANFLILPAHKLIPPAMMALVSGGEVRIDGFICPGHVSVIIGAKGYEELASATHCPCVVSGFEAADVLITIQMILAQLTEGRSEVEIEYRQCVNRDGSAPAQKLMAEVFEASDSAWRGLGEIPGSGLDLRPDFVAHDALKHFGLTIPTVPEPAGCMCGDVLRGAKLPTDCPLFREACTPASPVGPCMVSSEGSCQAYYKYA